LILKSQCCCFLSLTSSAIITGLVLVVKACVLSSRRCLDTDILLNPFHGFTTAVGDLGSVSFLGCLFTILTLIHFFAHDDCLVLFVFEFNFFPAARALLLFKSKKNNEAAVSFGLCGGDVVAQIYDVYYFKKPSSC